MLFYFISLFYFILFYFILFYFILFYFILFILLYFIYHFILFYIILFILFNFILLHVKPSIFTLMITISSTPWASKTKRVTLFSPVIPPFLDRFL